MPYVRLLKRRQEEGNDVLHSLRQCQDIVSDGHESTERCGGIDYVVAEPLEASKLDVLVLRRLCELFLAIV
jgi:hypothetical protein